MLLPTATIERTSVAILRFRHPMSESAGDHAQLWGIGSWWEHRRPRGAIGGARVASIRAAIRTVEGSGVGGSADQSVAARADGSGGPRHRSAGPWRAPRDGGRQVAARADGSGGPRRRSAGPWQRPRDGAPPSRAPWALVLLGRSPRDERRQAIASRPRRCSCQKPDRNERARLPHETDIPRRNPETVTLSCSRSAPGANNDHGSPAVPVSPGRPPPTVAMIDRSTAPTGASAGRWRDPELATDLQAVRRPGVPGLDRRQGHAEVAGDAVEVVTRADDVDPAVRLVRARREQRIPA